MGGKVIQTRKALKRMPLSERYSSPSPSEMRRMDLTRSPKRYAPPFHAPVIELVAAAQKPTRKSQLATAPKRSSMRSESVTSPASSAMLAPLAKSSSAPITSIATMKTPVMMYPTPRSMRIIGIQEGRRQPRSRTQ